LNSIYDYPRYYELSFSFRDIEQESFFMHKCIKKFSTIEVKSILEIACGHAPHAGRMTSMGYQYIGLDHNPTMIAYAKEKWHELKPSPIFVEGDMVEFKLEKHVEFAYVMLGSLYLNSNEQMKNHFKTMASAISTGGLYFLDWCIQISDPMKPRVENKVRFNGQGITIDSSFKIRLIDQSKQIYEELWTVDINDNGLHRKFNMIEHNRAVFPQEFLLFIENCTDFELVGWWHDWDLNKPLDIPGESKRPLAILRRC